ncbi:sepiapterin reductase [Cystoisospora suis]|uniref:Sepiapterin reductase n=1 Tax=Cystoisospora suis TaxID=483139 RepID=A0A2C6KNX9_9APIC|nr:sepiapterin reductase [Cystoisospora suis]
MVSQRERYLVFLLGASRGYGRSLAIQLAKALKAQIEEKKKKDDDSEDSRCMSTHVEGNEEEKKEKKKVLRLVLVGRDEKGMKETGEAACKAFGSEASYSVHRLDLSRVDDIFERNVDDLFTSSENFAQYDTIFLIHNSGWVQPACYLHRASSEDIRRSIDLNLTSFSILNARFLTHLTSLQRRREQEEEAHQPREEKDGETASSSSLQGAFAVRIIQISSLAAVEPFPSLPLYCTVKAGRDMQMRVIGEESTKSEDFLAKVDLKTLNWAPGQMVTDMQREVQQCEDPTIREAASNSALNVDLDDSAKALWQLVLQDTYVSGSHIDVHDVLKKTVS